ncbi:hypothetical protein J2W17_001321 [Pseudomonas lini]|uniref:hypothetical protein n=1 Tax=Pseudomonas lini TaxID=163011 RepID=UPI00277E9C89|nr:hypothetical protein [Pseudomonas lini]MDQ0122376.1 hypothetical protein [Pseudomonas lini]
MIERLHNILQGTIEITDTDKRFQAHCLRTLERFRAMGIADDFIPKKNPSIWNNAHSAALEDYQLGNDESLRYTADAIEAAMRQEIKAFEIVAGSNLSVAALEQMVKSESVRDLLLIFAIGLAFPSIDQMFGRYRFEAIANGELVSIYERLFEESVLTEGVSAIAIKGPNWRAPGFVVENRYV